jgi:Rrf2 family transcriptional regulator, iron-sulfur cluster assembly transcription factor
MFSKACEYAIRATVHIAERTAADEQVTVRSTADATGIPEAFTAKVLQKLVHAGLVGSMKGPGGGFNLTPARAKKLKLNAIVDAIDGDAIYTGCALGFPRCDERNPCALHDRFLHVRNELQALLEETSIQDLLSGATGLDALKRGKR